MVKKIVTTPKFRLKLAKVIEYIFDEFGNKAKLEFISKTDLTVQKIADNPDIGRPSIKAKNVKQIIIKPYNKLYYKIYPSRITLLDLFDMRQHPSKNPY
jgi:plasmid stabilization system protein ParE